MKLIKPNQISGEIMTLIAEADEKLILVSPYCNFRSWQKIKNALEMPKRKKIPVEFYVRHDSRDSLDQVKSIGFNPIQVKNLHTKLYMNENHAIVTSMNLLEYSDQNSLDIAYRTSDSSEYSEIHDYYKRYIKSASLIDGLTSMRAADNEAWRNSLETKVSQLRDAQFRIQVNGENEFIINGKNRYVVHISTDLSGNYINLCGILSQKQTDILRKNPQFFNREYQLEVCVVEARVNVPEYNTIWFHSKTKLISSKLGGLTIQDSILVESEILHFINAVEDYKSLK